MNRCGERKLAGGEGEVAQRPGNTRSGEEAVGRGEWEETAACRPERGNWGNNPLAEAAQFGVIVILPAGGIAVGAGRDIEGPDAADGPCQGNDEFRAGDAEEA